MMFLQARLFSLFFIGIGIIRGTADTECPSVFSPPRDRRSSSEKLRVVQYNVEWLFLDYYANSKCPGSGCTWVNQSEAELHLSTVAKNLAVLDADIVNFAEIEGCDELNALIGYNISTNYASYLKKGTDTATGQNVGMLTKIDPLVNLYRTEERVSYPIPGSKCGYTGPAGTSGVSKHYITEFDVNGWKIAFIGAHLLAIPTDPTRCSEREAQAQVLQDVIVEYYKNDYEIIMLGDFNDYDGEVLDSNAHHPISKVLDILKGIAGVHAGEYSLSSIAEMIPSSKRFTDWYDPNGDCISTSNEFSMIDHLLVTKGLQNNVDNAFIYQAYPEFCGKYNSDHYPVVVDFLF